MKSWDSLNVNLAESTVYQLACLLRRLHKTSLQVCFNYIAFIMTYLSTADQKEHLRTGLPDYL